MFEREDEPKASTTITPGVGPTIRPTFDVEELARDSGFRGVSSLLSETVLEIVPDRSWRDARLDLVETELLSQIDGVAPLVLLESTTTISRDELYATLFMLIARGFVRVLEEAPEAPPRSGVQLSAEPLDGLAADDRDVWACTG